jgi:hypothetical protein
MTKHQQPANEPVTAAGGIDKNLLYGQFLRGRLRKEKLHDAIIHKALDIPEIDDVNVTNINQRGQGLLGIFGAMVAAAGITAAGMKYFEPPIAPPIEPAEVEIEVWSDGEKFDFRVKE